MQFIIEICYNIKDKKEKQRKNIKKQKEGKGNKNEKDIKKNKHKNKSKRFLNRCFIFIFIINKDKCSLFFLYFCKTRR